MSKTSRNSNWSNIFSSSKSRTMLRIWTMFSSTILVLLVGYKRNWIEWRVVLWIYVFHRPNAEVWAKKSKTYLFDFIFILEKNHNSKLDCGHSYRTSLRANSSEKSAVLTHYDPVFVEQAGTCQIVEILGFAHVLERMSTYFHELKREWLIEPITTPLELNGLTDVSACLLIVPQTFDFSPEL